MKKTWEEEFDERFNKDEGCFDRECESDERCQHVHTKDLKAFISNQIKQAREEEREKIIEMVEGIDIQGLDPNEALGEVIYLIKEDV